MIRGSSSIITKINQNKYNLVRQYVTQVNAAVANESTFQQEWNSALSYDKIPGPSTLTLIKELLPGGKFNTLSLSDVLQEYRYKYGDLFKFPKMFGKPDTVFIFEPKDFETVFRNEGIWPVRSGLDSIEYYRRKVRPDLFVNGGLGITQGKEWAEFRSTVNPVMMQPKIVKLYVPRIDEVADEFIERMKTIRDPKTLELPESFEDELNRWTLEAVSIIALDTRLGLIGNINKDSPEQEYIQATKRFFDLLVQLDLKPSLWKIFPTKNFKEMMRVQDIIANFSSHYVLEAKKRLEDGKNEASEHEQSVLEKLVKIDPKIAIIMAIDMVVAGVDTTSSAITSVLYNLSKNPDKQEILRDELRKILPEKNSSLTPQNLSSLPYLRACIKEAFRITPVVNGNARQAGQDLVLQGYQIPKGTQITIQSAKTQISEKIYTNGTEFVPERWLKGNESEVAKQARNANPFTFLPFGFGPRMCIGRRFAELEIEVLVSKIIRNFNVGWEHPDLKFKSYAINLPDGKLQFKLTDIKN